MISPPSGSRIRVEPVDGRTLIEIPYASPGGSRYFVIAFLSLWLFGWAAGFMSALNQVLSGKGQAFIAIWLCLWTLGGGAVIYTLFRMMRPSVPERFLVGASVVSWDSGRPPVQWPTGWAYGYRTNSFAWWQQMFPKRRQIDFPQSALKSLRLRDTDSGNRLTIDVGSERLDIARAATEIEREWLFRVLGGSSTAAV